MNMFTNKDLRKLILPLIVEQFFQIFVGMADTFVVSYSSEADVSGVALVTSFNTILIVLFSALSAGGAVIISQYIGSKNKEKADASASQLLMISAVISVILTILILLFSEQILRLLFGKIEPDVMSACKTYLMITTWSLPALAVYDSGAAICRSIGKTNVTMYVSVAVNVLNVIGNCVGVLVLHLGAAGVAYPSLLSRIVSAVLITAFCCRKQNAVSYHVKEIFTWNRELLRRIMKIAIPNSVENGIHQMVKVALSSMVALFGTYQIAANGMAQNIWSLASIVALSMSPVYTTVIGQCMGANDIDAANFYFKKLNKITLISSLLWNAFVFAITPLIVSFTAVSAETKTLIIWLVLTNNIFNGLFFTYAGPLGSGLRAAGDVRYTMVTSVTLTIVIRLFFSALFGIWLHMGVIGVALGMSMDLGIRGFLFWRRLRSQKWTKFKVI